MKVTRQTTVVYYVEDDGDIYGGPFDTQAEAKECLRKYREDRKLDRDERDRQYERDSRIPNER